MRLGTAGRRKFLFSSAFSALSLFAHTHAAHADPLLLDIPERGEHRVVVDGSTADWERLMDLNPVSGTERVLSGQGQWRNDDDGSFQFALAMDADKLYVVAVVRDDQIVRTRNHAAREDAVVISLAGGQGRDAVAMDIALQPGVSGSFASSAKFRGGSSTAIPGATIVDGPLASGSGFVVECSIPWSALRGLKNKLDSLHGRVAYHDADNAANPTIESVIATGPGDAAHAAQLPLGVRVTPPPPDAAALIAMFLERQSLAAARKSFEQNLDVVGDRASERVVVVGNVIVAAGPGLAAGARYVYMETSAADAQSVLDVTSRDLTGDGHPELIVRVKAAEEQNLHRELLEVFTFQPEGVERIFAQELSRSQGSNTIVNRASYNASTIRIAHESSTGFTAANYPNVVDAVVHSPLTAFGPQRAVTYRWNNASRVFDEASSEANPNYHAPVAQTTTQTTVQGGTATTTGGGGGGGGASADVAGAFRVFREQHGVPATQAARYHATANVAGDSTDEELQIVGKFLVVAGRAFQGGRSYYSMELPVAAETDVLELSTGDVTGDGRAEAILRVKRPAQATINGQPAEVVREYILVYSIEEGHRGRVFAAEIARTIGSNSIRNTMRPIPRGTNSELVIQGGQATGWTAQTWPFSNETAAAGTVGLVLPWQTPATVTYRWNGTALAR